MADTPKVANQGNSSVSIRKMLNELPDSHLCMLVKVAHEAMQNPDACADVAEAIGIPSDALARFGAEQVDAMVIEAEHGLDVEAYAS